MNSQEFAYCAEKHYRLPRASSFPRAVCASSFWLVTGSLCALGAGRAMAQTTVPTVQDRPVTARHVAVRKSQSATKATTQTSAVHAKIGTAPSDAASTGNSSTTAPAKLSRTQLLPPLTSRPELYGQPQSLGLHQLPGALLHQGPWGVFNTNSGAAAGFGTVAYYAVARWAEDWSNLRDKRNHLDPMDALKYIPLNNEGDIYLSLSGNFRHHGFYDQNAGLGATKRSPSYRSNLRFNIGADLHLTEHVRLYGELMSGEAGGINYYGYTGRWRSKIDLHQAFLEIKGNILGAKTGVMIGRYKFLDAPAYFTGGSVYPSIPFSWNGVRGYAFWKRFRVDIFDLTQTNELPLKPFADTVGWRNRLFGAYTSYAVPEFKFLGQKSQIFADTFYLGFIVDDSSLAAMHGNTTGSTHRDTPGTRIWGNAGPIEFSVGGMWQGGTFQQAKNGPSRKVDAWAVNAQASWRFSHWWGRPSLGLQFDDVSGGDYRTSSTSTWGGFLSPYSPSASYLDLSTYFNMQNLISIGPLVTLTPTSNTSLQLKSPVMWRNSTHDGIYPQSTVAFPYRPRGHYTGVLPQASFNWRPTRHISFSLEGEYVFLGRNVLRSGAAQGAYVQTNLELTF